MLKFPLKISGKFLEVYGECSTICSLTCGALWVLFKSRPSVSMLCLMLYRKHKGSRRDCGKWSQSSSFSAFLVHCECFLKNTSFSPHEPVLYFVGFCIFCSPRVTLKIALLCCLCEAQLLTAITKYLREMVLYRHNISPFCFSTDGKELVKRLKLGADKWKDNT